MVTPGHSRVPHLWQGKISLDRRLCIPVKPSGSTVRRRQWSGRVVTKPSSEYMSNMLVSSGTFCQSGHSRGRIGILMIISMTMSPAMVLTRS